MIYFWHGFLGRGSDWAHVTPSLRSLGYFRPQMPDLLTRDICGESLEATALRLAREIEERDPEPVLVGYSMGGRLALHAVLARPKLFRRLVIVSASAGIAGDEARVRRYERDERWARRFEREAWPELWHAWNSQDVFRGSEPPQTRREQDFDRAALAWALRHWSPARQDWLGPRLHEVRCPVLWMAGAEDEAYVREARRAVEQLPRGTAEIVPGAGHRVPWEAREAFTSRLRSFLVR